MSTELINRITVKKGGVYLSSHSSNDTEPFHAWPLSVKCVTKCTLRLPSDAASMTVSIKTEIWNDKEVCEDWLRSIS